MPKREWDEIDEQMERESRAIVRSMTSMEITITHCRYTPKWETLEQVIREATNDESSTLVRINRISRCDNGCDYRKPGQYDLDVRRDNETILPVKLTVKAVGE